MNRFWNNIPFVRILFPLIGGILFEIFSPVKIPHPVIVSVVSISILLSLYLFRKSIQRYRHRWFYGLILNTTMILLGVALTYLNTQTNQPSHYSHSINDSEYYLVRLTDYPVVKERSVKLVARVMASQVNQEWSKSSGKLLLYCKKDSTAPELIYGDVLVIKNTLREIVPTQNPYEFDYKRYLRFHQIYHNAYLKTGEWELTGRGEGNKAFALIYSLRNNLLQLIAEEIKTENEKGVCEALLLGYTAELNDEIISAYSSTGAMHVLAVSGLHVAIIYLVLNFMFSFLNRNRFQKIFRALLILFLIWCYAIITGLSPSVLRASVMFTIIIGSKAMLRNASIYNTLACSCFILLCYNPYLITEVGFQLSYLAVVGIVYLQPKIYGLMIFRNWLLDKAWMITAVSIAAQIFTFPLGLLYFHQFPVYFLFSNLIVIPLTTLIIYVGITMFITSSFSPVITHYIGYITFELTRITNEFLFFIEHLRYALIKGITISIGEAYIVYMMIFFIIAVIVERIRSFVIPVLICVLLYFSFRSFQNIKIQNETALTVYHIPGKTAIEFRNGHELILLADSSLSVDENRMLFHIRHSWWAHRINNYEITTDLSEVKNPLISQIEHHLSFNILQFGDKRIAIISNPINEIRSEIKLKVDYLIVCKNPRLYVNELTRCFEFEKLIFDSSNPKWKTDLWIRDCRELKIPYHAVIYDKAFVAEL